MFGRLYFQKVGLIADTFLLTYIVSKFFRPSKRAKTIRFSENAVICQEDGILCLQVRIGDLRGKSLQSVSAHGVLVLESITDEGSVYPLYQNKLSFTVDCMQGDICLLWPVLLTHQITESSPFWTSGPLDLEKERFEIIIFLEGFIETTGELCQARTSYCQNEIFWGYRFQQILQFHESIKRWCVNFKDFDKIIETPVPEMSAKHITAICTGKDVLENPHFSTSFPGEFSEQNLKVFESMSVMSSPGNQARTYAETQDLGNQPEIHERRFSI
ncbi:G protein-activated inward rectifier potassium channel 3-like [Octopus vulgaris]|uniref:G protein-activated inward rectifier potassium channel 3-like n=1 Tax=Octopus vulgaris TaxID=6645 RepID=A0AA36AYT1_OCTVU|nr:G protein-activated inward rectifier potassium channel 3-like [Octopus vulgaris]